MTERALSDTALRAAPALPEGEPRRLCRTRIRQPFGLPPSPEGKAFLYYGKNRQECDAGEAKEAGDGGGDGVDGEEDAGEGGDGV